MAVETDTLGATVAEGVGFKVAAAVGTAAEDAFDEGAPAVGWTGASVPAHEAISIAAITPPKNRQISASVFI